MTLQVRPEALPEPDALRDLVLGALETLLGPTRVLARALPLEGEPALVVDGQGGLVLVAIDRADGAGALLSGLKALDGLGAAAGWLARTMTELPQGASFGACRLLVLAPTPPPGLDRLGRVSAAVLRAVRVGEEVGLLLEHAAPAAPVSEAASAAPRRRNPFRTGLVALTPEEAAFLARV